MTRAAGVTALVAVMAAAALGAAPSAAAQVPVPVPEAPAPPPRFLVTGDSMMYVMQQPLARRLRAAGAEAIPDSAFGTGITKPWILDWRVHARSQMAQRRPDVTLMFIGANDLFPLGGARCCSDTWVRRYAQRVRQLAGTYRTVYWLTLPAPRDRGLARGFRAVNRALGRAADVVRLVDIRPVFTPGGRYRRRMTWLGRRVVVRQLDGVHLSPDGSRIAADVLVQRLRADRVLNG